MEISDYLAVVRRRWVSIVLVMLVVVGAAAAVTLVQTPQYESNARLFVSTSETEDAASLSSGGMFSAQRVKSYADLIDSRELATRAADRLEEDVDPDQLVEQVDSEVGADTVNLTITATDPDPERAQRIAQAYAEGLAALVQELETAPNQEKAPIKATIVDTASAPESPVSPNVLRNLALAVVLGLLLGFGAAVLREILDTKVRSTKDLAALVDAPTLGVIGYDPDEPKHHLITDLSSHAPRAEAFRVLRTNLQFVDVDRSNRMFVVTSSVPEEGKTSTAVNLALSLARAGTKTLLIECDLRRPKAVHRLGLDGAIGVTNVLVGSVPAMEAIVAHESGLSILPCGPVPPNPAELLQSDAMTMLIMGLRQDFEVIIVDAPPLLPVTDAALLSAKSDGAILVARHGLVTKDQVSHAVERLENVGARLVGTVVSCAPENRGGYGYGYGYGYGDAPIPERDAKSVAPMSMEARSTGRRRREGRRSVRQ